MAAHPHQPVLLGPPDAALFISDVGEITNRLWGSESPGGRLYPAPLAAARVAVSRRKDGSRLMIAAEAIADIDEEDRRGGWSFLEGWVGDHLLGWHPDVSTTMYPVRVLALDLEWPEAVSRLPSFSATVASVAEWRDRMFFVRRSESGFEVPRTAAQLAALFSGNDEHSGAWWLAVRADHPGDVVHFLQDELTRSMPPGVEAGSEEEGHVVDWWKRRREHFALRIVADQLSWSQAMDLASEAG